MITAKGLVSTTSLRRLQVNSRMGRLVCFCQYVLSVEICTNWDFYPWYLIQTVGILVSEVNYRIILIFHCNFIAGLSKNVFYPILVRFCFCKQFLSRRGYANNLRKLASRWLATVIFLGHLARVLWNNKLPKTSLLFQKIPKSIGIFWILVSLQFFSHRTGLHISRIHRLYRRQRHRESARWLQGTFQTCFNTLLPMKFLTISYIYVF